MSDQRIHDRARGVCRPARGCAALRRVGRSVRTLALTGAILAPGCDFEVANPGPVQDTYLNDAAAFRAVANGSVRAFNEAMNYIALHGAVAARELFPTGQTGQFGIEPNNSIGYLEDSEQGTPWSNAQQARWLAEDGLGRFDEALDDATFSSHPIVAEAFLWAGYANRILGENMCVAIFDGGPPQDPAEYLKRAETHFTDAIEVGTAAHASAVVTAATAARAAVRVLLEDWAGAVTDASAVDDDFVFQVDYYEVGDEYQYNRIAWSSMNQPYKAHTVWGTVYEDYYVDTGDPRTPYMTTDDVGTGALDCCGAVPWYPQQKYGRTSAIDLSTGSEMRLIEAEALLRDGEWMEAAAIMNQLRSQAGVDPWVITGPEDAWAALKRERGIELWLEGRRLADLRRWQANDKIGRAHV